MQNKQNIELSIAKALLTDKQHFQKRMILFQEFLFHNAFNNIAFLCVVTMLVLLLQLKLACMKAQIFHEKTLERAYQNDQSSTTCSELAN